MKRFLLCCAFACASAPASATVVLPATLGELSREALLIADHNAYHLGELLLVRRLLGAWK